MGYLRETVRLRFLTSSRRQKTNAVLGMHSQRFALSITHCQDTHSVHTITPPGTNSCEYLTFITFSVVTCLLVKMKKINQIAHLSFTYEKTLQPSRPTLASEVSNESS